MRDPARSRVAAFAVVVLLCLVAGGGYVAWTAARSSSGGGGGGRGTAAVRSVGDAPALVFQNVARDDGYAHVAVASAGGPAAERTITPLVCERVHMAVGRGLCLTSRQRLTGPAVTAAIFDRKFVVRHKLSLPGLLSRARVSPDGRWGAVTSFVTGHSYADGGQFSTTTTLLDLDRGTKLGDLEDFRVTHDGRPVRAADRNFWGVTFAGDSGRFYATMRTGDSTSLIEGDIGSRRARTLHANVECPSLSPDGTRIAYKKRVEDGSIIWRLYVLDLRTMTEQALAETRMVDDQAEWLDDETVLYGLDGAVWSVPADGTGVPKPFLADALSPAVLRPQTG